MMRRVIAVVLIAATFAVGFAVGLDFHSQPPLPHCPEDAVIVGTGQFHNGTWTAYRCGPARDDFRTTGP